MDRRLYILQRTTLLTRKRDIFIRKTWAFQLFTLWSTSREEHDNKSYCMVWNNRLLKGISYWGVYCTCRRGLRRGVTRIMRWNIYLRTCCKSRRLQCVSQVVWIMSSVSCPLTITRKWKSCLRRIWKKKIKCPELYKEASL